MDRSRNAAPTRSAVVSRGESFVHIGGVTDEPRLARQRRRHPERLAPHLPAAVTELFHRLHRLERGVDLPAGLEVLARGRPQRPGGRGGVAGPGRTLDLRDEIPLEVLTATHEAVLAVRLEAEGMGVPARGEAA